MCWSCTQTLEAWLIALQCGYSVSLWSKLVGLAREHETFPTFMSTRHVLSHTEVRWMMSFSLSHFTPSPSPLCCHDSNKLNLVKFLKASSLFSHTVSFPPFPPLGEVSRLVSSEWLITSGSEVLPFTLRVFDSAPPCALTVFSTPTSACPFHSAPSTGIPSKPPSLPLPPVCLTPTRTHDN